MHLGVKPGGGAASLVGELHDRAASHVSVRKGKGRKGREIRWGRRMGLGGD